MQTVWTLDFFRKRFPLRSVKLSGGATKSPFWTQMVADIANCPINVPMVSDLTCIGAGIMAGVGAGIYRSCEEGSSLFRVEQTEYRPNPASAQAYSELFERYKADAGKLPGLYERGGH